MGHGMFVDYLIGVVDAILLLVVGFYGVFRPLKLIAFYKRIGSKRFVERLDAKTEDYGFFLNLKICGIIFFISGLALSAFLVMHLLKKW
jgi:hypothetical protein